VERDSRHGLDESPQSLISPVLNARPGAPALSLSGACWAPTGYGEMVQDRGFREW
jgi:hypothetical protein